MTITSRREPFAARVGLARWNSSMPDVPGLIRVIDVEPLAARVVRGEGDGQQPALAAVGHIAAQVEERLAQPVAVPQDRDPPRLLDDEEELGEAGRSGHVDRGVERPDLLQADAAALRPGGATGAGRIAGRTAGGQRQAQQQRQQSRGCRGPTCLP
ncbi:MAG TPA: hypothetical protein VFP21_05970 [Solirubrobacterales bacterium]|nr:hypothetical protein [Solirubrobacterales bacterium]